MERGEGKKKGAGTISFPAFAKFKVEASMRKKRKKGTKGRERLFLLSIVEV
jgi:hypothetical protein